MVFRSFLVIPSSYPYTRSVPLVAVLEFIRDVPRRASLPIPDPEMEGMGDRVEIRAVVDEIFSCLGAYRVSRPSAAAP